LKIIFFGSLRGELGITELELRLENSLRLREVLRMLPENLQKKLLDSSGSPFPDLLILLNDIEVTGFGIEEFWVSDEDTIVFIPVIHRG